jgi:outer membrane receptor protein involved in Fe transport
MTGALLAASALIAVATPAWAQTAAEKSPAPVQDPAPSETAIAEIVVTGTRITASGFTAPTPTTVISMEQLQATAAPNLYDSIAQLPSLQGSAGTTNRVQNGNTSIGSNGLSSLNLRGLGSSRTLVLIDSQRVVPAYITGVTDVSQFPQLLIKRVDVVTGGASASWGSDAVAGVVNFVTDTKFTGVKANVQGGISTYGDDFSILGQAAAGIAALDDRLHIQVSGELYDNKGVPGGLVGGAQPNGRPVSFRSGTTSYALNAVPAGQPQFWAFPYDAQLTTFSRYGLITAGPNNLKNLAFDGNGGVTPFVFGSPCIGTTCQGGQQDAYITTTTIDNPLRRAVGYGRIGFDITPDIELYGSLIVARTKTENTPIAYPRKNANLTIKCSNAFLANTVIPSLCAANAPATTTFTIGATAMQMPDIERILTDRKSLRYVLGTAGKFNVGSTPISFDLYYQHGQNKANIDLKNMTLTPRFNAAVDAVFLNGAIVCNSAVARAAGCIPINLFSSAQISPAAFAWIAPPNGPYQHNVFKEDVASIAFNATPFDNWAGPVSIALGAEWRKESYVARADPYGNGVAADSPNTAEYPADSLLSTGGTNWFAGNYRNGQGEFSVKEGFLEVGLPLLPEGSAIGKIDLNLAGRIEDYSTAGNATTWKIGGTWDTPLDGLRLRAVVSRDVRAPNLNELFTPSTAQTQNISNRLNNNANVQLINQGIGNPNLRPEIGKTWEVGAVYRPQFIPGLNLSFDYYDIELKDAISTLGIQQIVDLCQVQQIQSYCANVKLTGTLGTADYPYVIVQPFNLASQHVRGFDIEASYQLNLGNAGKVILRGLATRTITYTNDTGISGQQIAQLAGRNDEGGAGVPKWKALFTQSWSNDVLTLNLTERLVSAGKIDPEAIVCASSCPASTVQHPTYNFNYIPGAVYVDFGATYKLPHDMEVYFKADNVFNHRSPPFGASTLYDQIGTMFRLGARIKF